MSFEEWFNDQPEWWHEDTAKGVLESIWNQLETKGLDAADIIGDVIYVMRNEYGE